MAIIKKNEFKQMDEQTAISKLEELHKELLKINAQRATHTPPENPGRAKAIRRVVARLYTMLTQKSKQAKTEVKEIKREKTKEVKKTKHE
ncbi:50S ribosomal protein L29 [Candidatus Woesearchaeota archaeon]|nr:50S ribosomal protein L29 [Candidatus Woesearchaeota archaeon]